MKQNHNWFIVICYYTKFDVRLILQQNAERVQKLWSLESYVHHLACQLRSIDVMLIKKANKVSSIPRSIRLYESIIDIDTSKVSSIISISIFYINNPACKELSDMWQIKAKHKVKLYRTARSVIRWFDGFTMKKNKKTAKMREFVWLVPVDLVTSEVGWDEVGVWNVQMTLIGSNFVHHCREEGMVPYWHFLFLHFFLFVPWVK